MTAEIQVTVDASNPHAQADWWAMALGWTVEPQDEAFIRDMIAKGYATDDETLEHNGRLVWRTGAAIRHPDDVDTTPVRRVLFQWVPEAKTVKNRMHLDVHVGADHAAAEVERLLTAGATRLWEGRQGPQTWVTLADPEGNEFCVS